MSAKKDMLGKQFGDWYVLEEDKEKYRHYICKCTQCGKIKSVHGYSLRSGKSTSCGCVNGIGLKDETGNKYGMLTVQKYLGNKKWQCICECGKTVIAYGKDLRNGDTTSCGSHRYIDLKGQTFGAWKVISYAGDNYWNCKCECGTEKIVLGQNLRNGRSSSCGCKSGEKKAESFKSTMKMKYGEISSKRARSPRESWQVEIVEDTQKLVKYLNQFSMEHGRKPSVMELTIMLDTSYSTLIRKMHEYNLETYVNFNGGVSFEERQVKEYIRSIYSGQIIENNRSLLGNLELDIYLPDLKLAIEYNGTYWHCDDVVHMMYHQNKTIQCEKLGIRLIHIFDYEWLSPSKREKLKNLIYNSIHNDRTRIYARDCKVIKPTLEQVRDFTDKFHLQSHSNYSLAYALEHDGDIVSLMTFGSPRFNKDYEWELIRLVNKADFNIIGGSSKLFNAFKQDKNPKSVISYCDKSKFVGKVYPNMGFTKIRTTDPNYVWVNSKFDILPRYRTTKKILVEQGLGDESMSETEIMKCLHYMKVYDCGNDVYVWHL